MLLKVNSILIIQNELPEMNILTKGVVMTLSQTENKVLMAQARESLTGNWKLAIGTCLVYLLLAIGISYIPGIGFIAQLIIAGPLGVGISIFSLSIARNQEPKFDQLFEGFQNFDVALGTYLLMILFILLWMLLLIIPGIIASLAYSQIFYILAEDKNIGPMDALAKSKQMMQGNKWKYFCLGLRFIGWALLCVLTLGIGFLWLSPYAYVSYAKFYDDLKVAGPELS